jgi:hypothetical protein
MFGEIRAFRMFGESRAFQMFGESRAFQMFGEIWTMFQMFGESRTMFPMFESRASKSAVRGNLHMQPPLLFLLYFRVLQQAELLLRFYLEILHRDFPAYLEESPNIPTRSNADLPLLHLRSQVLNLL